MSTRRRFLCCLPADGNQIGEFVLILARVPVLFSWFLSLLGWQSHQIVSLMYFGLAIKTKEHTWTAIHFNVDSIPIESLNFKVL